MKPQPQPAPPPAGPKTKVEWITIGAEDAGQRIDNFLLRQLKGIPRSRVYRVLRRGEVRVNRGRIRPEYRLQAGDQVRLPPLRRPDVAASGLPPIGMRDLLARSVLFEDEHWLVVNKPAGVAVHGGSGVRHGVIECLRALRPESRFLELVHRLDRDTSGCLVLAKRRSALRLAHEHLRLRRAHKSYIALLRGVWEGDTRVDVPLTRYVVRSGERFVRPDRDGKEAVSEFHLLDHNSCASLVRVRLLTGRTHQIRVHAASAGHPVGGDPKYGDPAFNRWLKGHGLDRLFLHAHRLRLGRADAPELAIDVPLPAELVDVAGGLGLRLPLD